MKVHTVIALCAALLAGCSAIKESNTSNRETANAVPAKSNTNTVANVAPPVNGARTGEKVDNVVEFDFKNGIPAGWDKLDPETSNPSGWDTSNGVLKLRIPGGKDLYGDNRLSPRLIRNVTGDFEIETRLKFAPKSDYQGAGLLIFRNDNNFLRLERGLGGIGGGGDGIKFARAEDESFDELAAPANSSTNAAEVDLKLKRRGKLITAFWRPAGKSDWIEVGQVSNSYPETVVVGLIGVNTGEEITAEFAYVKLLPSR
ncbi:MAG: DUF1349 domain-containing protein [Acidobacteria bacterium]|nr:DUF1349 domain-containing protein [Acidobacteriota bacterium]